MSRIGARAGLTIRLEKLELHFVGDPDPLVLFVPLVVVPPSPRVSLVGALASFELGAAETHLEREMFR